MENPNIKSINPEVTVQYSVAALGELLHDWLDEVDYRNGPTWYEHIIINDFKCGCGFDVGYDGPEVNECAWWRENGKRVADVAEAWNQANKEYEVRKWREYEQAWREAHEIDRQINHFRNEAAQLKLAGERWHEFVKRLMP